MCFSKKKPPRREGAIQAYLHYDLLLLLPCVCLKRKLRANPICTHAACEHRKVTRTAISSKITPWRKIEAGEYYIIFRGSILEVSR